MSEEEKFPKYEDEEDTGEYLEKLPTEPKGEEPSVELTFGGGTETTIEGQNLEALEAKKKKRRKWWLIGIFGITLPILIIVGVIVFIFMSIIGAFESCAVQCCTNCGDSCAQSCSDTCAESCADACTCSCDTSSCCSSSIGKITFIDVLQNAKNQIMWLIYLVFGI